MKTLEAHEQSISKIFSEDYVFEIPGYQRPYSWTTEQAGELFSDLLDFMHSNDGEIDEKKPPYFLGSIVLIKEPALPKAKVVDGQQRLTTLTLLLSAIRHRLVEAEEKECISKILMEKANKIRRTENRYRLALREQDRMFFQEHVQDEKGFAKLLEIKTELSDSQKLLKQNAILFASQLAALSPKDSFRLAELIINHCCLVTVSTPDFQSAFRIFNVLNSRGLDLSATDILKSKITGEIQDKTRDTYTKKWEELEDTLGRESFSELFSHIRMIYRKAKPQGTLLKEFEDHVPLSFPESFIDDILVPLAAVYHEIRQAKCQWDENQDEINDRLKWINRIPFSDWVPPTLAFINRHQNKPEKVLKFLEDMERLIYSMLVRKAGINERIERFSELTLAIEKGEEIFDLPKSPLQLLNKEIEATMTALSGPLYETHSARACAILLVRLDSLLSGGGATYDYPVISIEHVLPQNPAAGSTWLSWFPDPMVQAHWVHRLGNLALLSKSKNSSAKNFEFERKKEECFKKRGVSPFVLTTQIIDAKEWTPKTVEARHNALLELYKNHWRLSPLADEVAMPE